MNKPAQKEPSMDEILSSIRQIIADDDAAAMPKPAAQIAGSSRPAPVLKPSTLPPVEKPVPPAAATAQKPQPSQPGAPAPMPQPDAEGEEDAEPLALSAEQMLRSFDEDSESGVTPDPEPVASEMPDDDGSVLAAFIDPDDVAFDAQEDEEPVASGAEPPPPGPAASPRSDPEAARPAAPPVPGASRFSQGASMPDPTLSRDMAEQLLGPATKAAVQGSMARLNNLGIGTQGVTLESMIREMLRPMLKEWLDEHLPSVVERMVEKEIARVSRGAD